MLNPFKTAASAYSHLYIERLSKASFSRLDAELRELFKILSLIYVLWCSRLRRRLTNRVRN